MSKEACEVGRRYLCALGKVSSQPFSSSNRFIIVPPTVTPKHKSRETWCPLPNRTRAAALHERFWGPVSRWLLGVSVLRPFKVWARTGEGAAGAEFGVRWSSPPPSPDFNFEILQTYELLE